MAALTVIVPAWRSDLTLRKCVECIASSLIPPGVALREVIVVDDGAQSQACLADINGLAEVELTVLGTEHGGQSRASNAAAMLAQGDILVFLDSDMLINPGALGAAVSLHLQSDRSLVFGFRENISPDRFTNLDDGDLRDRYFLEDDNRFVFHVPGFPSSLMHASRWLQDLSPSNQIHPPGKEAWWLARMAYGCFMTCDRQRFLSLGGFDAALNTWGYNDTDLARRWIASGGSIFPCVEASGFHVEHKPRHPAQWRLHAIRNQDYYWSTEGRPWSVAIHGSKIVWKRRHRIAARVSLPDASRPCRPVASARRAAVIGELNDVLDALQSQPEELLKQREYGLVLRCLRLSGSEQYLSCPLPHQALSGEQALEVALALAARGAQHEALQWLSQAIGEESRAGAGARHLLSRSPKHQLGRAARHLAEGLPRAAASDLASLLISPQCAAAQRETAAGMLRELSASDARTF